MRGRNDRPQGNRYRLDEFELDQATRKFRYEQHRRRARSLDVTGEHAFCRMARGSPDELPEDFNVCLDQGYGKPADINDLRLQACQRTARINGDISYLQKSRQGAA